MVERRAAAGRGPTTCHSDPRITTEVYGHLLPGYLRTEIDRLAFGFTILEAAPASIPSQAVAANAATCDTLVTGLGKSVSFRQECVK